MSEGTGGSTMARLPAPGRRWPSERDGPHPFDKLRARPIPFPRGGRPVSPPQKPHRRSRTATTLYPLTPFPRPRGKGESPAEAQPGRTGRFCGIGAAVSRSQGALSRRRRCPPSAVAEDLTERGQVNHRQPSCFEGARPRAVRAARTRSVRRLPALGGRADATRGRDIVIARHFARNMGPGPGSSAMAAAPLTPTSCTRVKSSSRHPSRSLIERVPARDSAFRVRAGSSSSAGSCDARPSFGIHTSAGPWINVAPFVRPHLDGSNRRDRSRSLATSLTSPSSPA